VTAGVPDGWLVEERSKVAGFVTREVYRLPDGTQRVWESRRRRKSAHPHIGRWCAILFMVGSFLFALGAIPAYADAVGGSVDAGTFFLGSIFFTAAGYLQFVQAINAPDATGIDADTRFRWFAYQPHRIDWWACTVQSAGTLFFNVSTFAATLSSLDPEQARHLVWAPDMFGSIAFMIASTLAWLEVVHGWFGYRPHDTGWWIAALNLGGSIAFQISAIAAVIDPQTGEAANIQVANLGTFVGAVGFFFGAWLLFPEMRRARGEPALP
jgi:predicted membrane protein